MKLKFRMLKIFILLIGFMFLLNFMTKKNKERKLLTMQINIIDFEEKKFISEENVKKIIEKELGKFPKKIQEVDIKKIEKKLKKNSYVDSTNISIDINGKLMVYIKQRTPIARINNTKKQFYLSDKGKWMPLSENYSHKCMLIDGIIQVRDTEKLIKLIQEIQSDNLLKTHITGIKKLKNKSFILFINYGGYSIEFGELENCSQKLENLKEFYRQYLNRIPTNMYSTISLKYKNQIVAVKK